MREESSPPSESRSGVVRLPEDDRYVRSRFCSFERLVTDSGTTADRLRSWQGESLYPGPTYITPDGTEWYPPAYAHFTRRAIYQREDLHAVFAHDFLGALDRLRERDAEFYGRLVADAPDPLVPNDHAVEEYWAGVLTGEWGACLKEPWVRNMILRDRLVRRVDRLTHRPAPDVPHWVLRLRHAVETLDRLMLPFAECDRTASARARLRESHVEVVRARFPEVFGPVPPAPAPPVSLGYPVSGAGLAGGVGARAQRFR